MADWTEAPRRNGGPTEGSSSALGGTFEEASVPCNGQRRLGSSQGIPGDQRRAQSRSGLALPDSSVRRGSPSVYQAIQKVTMTALKQISRDYRAHLEDSPYRFLPQNPLTT
ncbi:hypothetical protein U9M48_002895 [Paspalum notatum var. saurae]|uniref:Uncharacterized protein n=1 Tax=Paspalum notatum var. saurae TaxID=547442 RepID=A0AAQ3PKA1_PASNO